MPPSNRDDPWHGINHEPVLGRDDDQGAHAGARAADSDEIGMEPARAGPGADYGVNTEHLHALGDEPALKGLKLGTTVAPGFRELYRQRREKTRDRQRWLALIIASVVAGPAAILGAFMNDAGSWWMILTVWAFAPIIEEMLKVSGMLYLAEQRPWLIPAWWTIPLGTLISGLVFAAIENLWYLYVLLPDPQSTVIQWRWTVCLALHGACSLIAGLGVARMWRQTHETGRAPRPASAAPLLIVAIILHGMYNVTVTMLEATHVLF